MSRALLLVAMWSFLCAPVMCISGALDHSCPCTVDETCGHEDSCAVDPCQTLGSARVERPVVLPSLTSSIVTTTSTNLMPTCKGAEPPAVPSLPVRLPYPPSDLPLLI